jgi:dipeptidyl aminopeptidase/acylaminoacyl peptidase
MRLCVLFLAISATLCARTPLTHESIWLLSRVGAPVPSPDGKLAVFPVTEPAYSESEQSTDLWLVPTDGSAKPRQITFTKAGESGVAWSPDGKRIAFATRRDGDESPQIYLLDLTGGEARRITTLTLGASSPKFSPDGKMLLFNSTVYPGATTEEQNKKLAAERKARKYNARVYESFPIRQWDRWVEDTQTHLYVMPLDGSAKPKDLLAGTKLTAEKGYFGNPTSSGDDPQGEWTPDGKAIVFTASTNRNSSAFAFSNTHLYSIPVTGGEPQQLTTGADSYSDPQFRPDGKALYCLHERAPGAKMYSLSRIAMFPWNAGKLGERSLIAGNFDRSVSKFVITSDSSRLFFTAEDAGVEKLYRLPAQGGTPELAYDIDRGVYTNLAIAEDAPEPVLLANYETATQPNEIVRIDLAAKGHKRLSEFTVKKVSELELPPIRHFWHTSSKGKKIHSWIAVPPGFDETKKYPLFVLIHGGPHGMWRDQFFLRWNYHLIANPGYVVLMTDYSGSTGYGEAFAQAVEGDPLKGPADEINEAADAAIKQFAFIDGTRQAAGGASYGGHLANWLQATTTRYKCLISHAGLVNLESQWATSDTIYGRERTMGGPIWEGGAGWREQNPIRYAAKFKTPILVTVGERDFRVPLNNSLENWSVLQRMKVPSKLIVFPDENHWILKGENSRFFYQQLHEWLARWL